MLEKCLECMQCMEANVPQIYVAPLTILKRLLPDKSTVSCLQNWRLILSFGNNCGLDYLYELRPSSQRNKHVRKWIISYSHEITHCDHMTFIYQAKYIWLQVTLDMLCDTYQSDIREFWRILPTLFARGTHKVLWQSIKKARFSKWIKNDCWLIA